jgi:hypothetical protein
VWTMYGNWTKSARIEIEILFKFEGNDHSQNIKQCPGGVV